MNLCEKHLTGSRRTIGCLLGLLLLTITAQQGAQGATLTMDPSGASIVVCIGTSVSVSATVSEVDYEKTAVVTISGGSGQPATGEGSGSASASYTESHDTPTTSTISASGTDATDQTVTVYWIAIDSVEVDNASICPMGSVSAVAHTTPLDGQEVCETRWAPCDGPCLDGYDSGGLSKSYSPTTTGSWCDGPTGGGDGCDVTITATSVNGQAQSGGSASVHVGAWGPWEILTPPTITVTASGADPQCVNYRSYGIGFLSDPTAITVIATTNITQGTRHRSNGCGAYTPPVELPLTSLIFEWTASGANASPSSGSGTIAAVTPSANGACAVTFTLSAASDEPVGLFSGEATKTIHVKRHDQAPPQFTAPLDDTIPGGDLDLGTYVGPDIPITDSNGQQIGYTHYLYQSATVHDVVINRHYTPGASLAPSACGDPLPLTQIVSSSWHLTFGVSVGISITIDGNSPATNQYFFGPSDCPGTPDKKWHGKIYDAVLSVAGGTVTGNRTLVTFTNGMPPVFGTPEPITDLPVPLMSGPPITNGGTGKKVMTDCCGN